MEITAIVCPKCGANLEIKAGNNKKVFCQYCGAQIMIEESNQKSVSVEDKVALMIDKFELKEYEEVKKLAKEIQESDGNNFYGWYYALLALKESPFEGKAGSVFNALNKFSSNIMAGASIGDKKKKEIELVTKANTELANLINEKFMALYYRALSCSSKLKEDGEEQNKQYSLLFDLIGNAVESIWAGFATKEYCKKFAIVKRDAKYMLAFLQEFIAKNKEYNTCDTEQYKKCMERHCVAFTKCNKKLRYKTNIPNPAKKQIKKILSEFAPDYIPTENVQTADVASKPAYSPVSFPLNMCIYAISLFSVIIGVICGIYFKDRDPKVSKISTILAIIGFVIYLVVIIVVSVVVANNVPTYSYM